MDLTSKKPLTFSDKVFVVLLLMVILCVGMIVADWLLAAIIVLVEALRL